MPRRLWIRLAAFALSALFATTFASCPGAGNASVQGTGTVQGPGTVATNPTGPTGILY